MTGRAVGNGSCHPALGKAKKLPSRTSELSLAVSDAESLRLDDEICFSLHAASLAFIRMYRLALKNVDLTYPQYLVMRALWELGELPINAIGRHVRLDSGTVSPLVKRLEAAGYVERRRSAADERSVTARLTAHGKALRQEVTDIPGSMVRLTGLSPDEIHHLQAYLTGLTASLDEAARRATRRERDSDAVNPTPAASLDQRSGP